MFVRHATTLFLLGSSLCLAPLHAPAQDRSERHGRKYKAPPETSRVEVHVIKHSTGKPVMNAAVVFRPVKDGKDQGNLEVKTDPDGRAAVDIIPTGSTLQVQVIANGFATFAEEYTVSEPSKSIEVSMLRPQEQISAYEDNSGKASSRKPGVQEPVKPDTQKQPATPPKPKPNPPSNTTTPPTSPQTGSPNL